MTTPRTPMAVKHDLTKVISNMIEAGIADDQNFPVLKQISSVQWEVSFIGAEHISLAMGDIDYADIHREFSEKRSYSAKLLDGGLLQLAYIFEGNNLIRHRLAYLPSPSLRPFQEDPDIYLRDELFLDVVSRHIVPFPLRFDFDETSAVDIIHPRCHLTLGDIKNCRIPVSTPLTPRWFVDFILRNFYQTDKHDFISKLPTHQLHFKPTITKMECSLIHVFIPEKI